MILFPEHKGRGPYPSAGGAGFVRDGRVSEIAPARKIIAFGADREEPRIVEGHSASARRFFSFTNKRTQLAGLHSPVRETMKPPAARLVFLAGLEVSAELHADRFFQFVQFPSRRRRTCRGRVWSFRLS